MKRIYLDWNATAPLLPSVTDAMIAALHDVPGNASSIHQEGQGARTLVERARRAVARALQAPPQAVVLTGGATESNNLVLRDFARRFPAQRIHVTRVEHPSVIEVARDLERSGTPIRWVDVDATGTPVLDFDHVEPGDLVSCMWANNEIGNVFPVKDIAAAVHDRRAFLHVDATQALGRVPVTFQDTADYMSLSFHKMGGPKGVGALVVREGRKVEAVYAGGHQERGRRPGTENVPAIAGLEAAMRELTDHQATWQASLLEKRQLTQDALARISGLYLRGALAFGLPALPNTLNFMVEGIDGEDILLALDLEGVALSSGSACTAGSLEPSHVLLAMGMPPRAARQSVRLSFGPATSSDELIEACERIQRTVDRLRRI